MNSIENRIIYYYQTLTDLSYVLFENTPVTHIMLSSFHFGNNKDGSPYIHLNDNPPTDSKFDKVWSQLLTAFKNYNIEIDIMLGGAGGAFQVLFSDFDTYYPMLIKIILDKPYIQGINLDIEEEVSLTDVRMLIFCLKRDLGPSFSISMAPIQGSLQSDEPGMGGFSYKDLYKTPEGGMIDYFNGQFYFNLSSESFDDCVKNGYPSNKVVLGMIQSQDISNATQVVESVKKQYPNFGGVFMWEYYDAPPQGTKNPGAWATLMKKIIDSNIVNTSNIDETSYYSYCSIS